MIDENRHTIDYDTSDGPNIDFVFFDLQRMLIHLPELEPEVVALPEKTKLTLSLNYKNAFQIYFKSESGFIRWCRELNFYLPPILEQIEQKRYWLNPTDEAA